VELLPPILFIPKRGFGRSPVLNKSVVLNKEKLNVNKSDRQYYPKNTNWNIINIAP
jgi:hypothetical protein